jgi:hypothetical protein
MYLVREHNASNALWIPEQLVYIIITNDAVMITFSSHELAINRLVALITNEPIKGLNDSAKVKAFWDGIDAILALGRAVVVVRAFEDKAEALGNKSDLSRLSPTKEVEGYLAHAVILGHVVHCLTPAFEGTSKRLLGMAAATATLGPEALKTWVLSMTNGIIEIKLGSKVPLAVICVLPPDVVRVKGEECLVGRHARRTAIKQVHREVELGWP